MVEDEAKICWLERSERQDLCLGSVTLALREAPPHPSQGEETAPEDSSLGSELLKWDSLGG